MVGVSVLMYRCGSAFDVAVVSDAFEGKMLIARHRMVSTGLSAWEHMADVQRLQYSNLHAADVASACATCYLHLSFCTVVTGHRPHGMSIGLHAVMQRVPGHAHVWELAPALPGQSGSAWQFPIEWSTSGAPAVAGSNSMRP
jgi:hypothetical protein